MKRIVFLTGTRADFGKMKSLMHSVNDDPNLDLFIFVTGMHLELKYGYTVEEVTREGFGQICAVPNSVNDEDMALRLSRTIENFSVFVRSINPDLIVIHGDRLEALAGAIVGSFNNILTAHIEGGEISGTIDELIRHSVTKLSHYHFVSSEIAKNRVIKLGEDEKNIEIFGSPDLEIMLNKELPDINEAKFHYDIDFGDFYIVLWHPVTTEIDEIKENTLNLRDAILDSGYNYIWIYPNNDPGSDSIIKIIEPLGSNSRIKIFPSLRFEYFLTLMKHSLGVIGNSSAGIREAPVFNVPSINIGSRQDGRTRSKSVVDCGSSKNEIIKALSNIKTQFIDESDDLYGANFKSSSIFMEIIKSDLFWKTKIQKKLIEN